MVILKGGRKKGSRSEKIVIKNVLKDSEFGSEDVGGEEHGEPQEPIPTRKHLFKQTTVTRGNTIYLKKVKKIEPALEGDSSVSAGPDALHGGMGVGEVDRSFSSGEDIGALRAEVQEQAETDAKSYREKAFHEIDREKEDVLAKAYHEGYEKGEREGREMLAEQSKELLRAIDEAVAGKEVVFKKAQPEILKLSVEIAKKIVNGELSMKPDAILNIVEDALSRITEKDKVIIRVHKDDLEAVKAQKSALMEKMKDIKVLEIQEDKYLASGGCIIETSLGYIDSSISTKLGSIQGALLEAYEEELGEGKKF